MERYYTKVAMTHGATLTHAVHVTHAGALCPSVSFQTTVPPFQPRVSRQLNSDGSLIACRDLRDDPIADDYFDRWQRRRQQKTYRGGGEGYATHSLNSSSGGLRLSQTCRQSISHVILLESLPVVIDSECRFESLLPLRRSQQPSKNKNY